MKAMQRLAAVIGVLAVLRFVVEVVDVMRQMAEDEDGGRWDDR